jgi:hypothetical protein
MDLFRKSGFAAACACAVFAVGPASAQGVSFSGDWETGITGRGTWGSRQTVSEDRIQRVISPVRQGRYAARVEVRPGDDPINSSGERSEVLIMTDAQGNKIYENESSGTQWFAYSVMIAPGWQAPSGWALLFQLHGPDRYAASPSIGMTCKDAFGIDITAGDLHGGNPTKNKYRAFSDGSLNEGTWVDFLMKVKFARDSSGSVTVWRRNQGRTAFAKVYAANTPTLQYNGNTVENHYWKHGLYRGISNVTNVLYLDGMMRGTDSAAVVRAAFSGAVSVVLRDRASQRNTPTGATIRLPGAGIGLWVTPATPENSRIRAATVDGKAIWAIRPMSPPPSRE